MSFEERKRNGKWESIWEICSAQTENFTRSKQTKNEMDNILHIHFRFPLVARRLIVTSSTRNRMNQNRWKIFAFGKKGHFDKTQGKCENKKYNNIWRATAYHVNVPLEDVRTQCACAAGCAIQRIPSPVKCKRETFKFNSRSAGETSEPREFSISSRLIKVFARTVKKNVLSCH